MRAFAYRAPATIAEAVRAHGAFPDGRYLAGGMSLLPVMKHDLAAPSALVDLRKIESMRSIRVEGTELVIGAMTRHAAVAGSSLVRERLPALARLAGGIGDPQVRHRGTAGGSVANNDPAADYPAACLALDATIVTDRRRLAAESFFDGFFSTALAPGELVTELRFALPAVAGYAKFAQQASRFALTGVFVARHGERVRVAVTGAGRSGVFRARELEAALERDFDPSTPMRVAIDVGSLASDLHASARYRAQLVRAMAKRAVAAALGREVALIERHGGASAW